MGKNFTAFFLLGSALLLGLRHGLDWDHLAAITDITGASENERRGFVLGSLYAFGHAFVIVCLGLLAVLIGVTLPTWVDRFMEPVVGITLILLSVYVTVSIVHHRRTGEAKPRFRSRWMLTLHLLKRFHHFVHEKLGKEHHHFVEKEKNYNSASAFGVGMIHGIGAETPTQIVLFATAAGVSGRTLGSLILFAFVVGLIASNTIIVLLSSLGYNRATENQSVWTALGIITAAFSFIVGVLFLTGRAAILPSLLGG